MHSAVLCAVLCCAVLCCAVLCCAVLCCNDQGSQVLPRGVYFMQSQLGVSDGKWLSRQHAGRIKCKKFLVQALPTTFFDLPESTPPPPPRPRFPPLCPISPHLLPFFLFSHFPFTWLGTLHGWEPYGLAVWWCLFCHTASFLVCGVTCRLMTIIHHLRADSHTRHLPTVAHQLPHKHTPCSSGGWGVSLAHGESPPAQHSSHV